MTIMTITEYERVVETSRGAAPVGVEPAHAIQVVTFTATAGVSAAFNARTKFVRIAVSGNANILFGANPTAVTDASTRLAAGQTEYFGTDPASVVTGLKVSAVDATT